MIKDGSLMPPFLAVRIDEDRGRVADDAVGLGQSGIVADSPVAAVGRPPLAERGRRQRLGALVGSREESDGVAVSFAELIAGGGEFRDLRLTVAAAGDEKRDERDRVGRNADRSRLASARVDRLHLEGLVAVAHLRAVGAERRRSDSQQGPGAGEGARASEAGEEFAPVHRLSPRVAGTARPAVRSDERRVHCRRRLLETATDNCHTPVVEAMTDERERWNERYGDVEFELPDKPIPVLERRIATLPEGRALDVATGTGRNALFLAEHGYEVDAIDISDAAIERARDRADERGLEVNWRRADLADVELPTDEYDVLTVSFFAALERLPDLKDALAPGGVLIHEHHLRSSDPVEVGPSSERFRYRSNDLLRACLDLTILAYAERRRPVAGGTAAVATLVARNSRDGTQSYPTLEE